MVGRPSSRNSHFQPRRPSTPFSDSSAAAIGAPATCTHCTVLCERGGSESAICAGSCQSRTGLPCTSPRMAEADGVARLIETVRQKHLSEHGRRRHPRVGDAQVPVAVELIHVVPDACNLVEIGLTTGRGCGSGSLRCCTGDLVSYHKQSQLIALFTWEGAAFCDAEQEAQDVELSGVAQAGEEGGDDAPGDDGHAQPRRRAEAQQDEVAGHLEHRVAQEEDACGPDSNVSATVNATRLT